jgi:hypothetical protein
MNKTRLIPLSLLFVAASCTERIDVKLDETYTRLVVSGHITTDSVPAVVSLTTTSAYFSNTPSPKVTGAEVTISDGTTFYTLRETVPGHSGIYSSLDPLPGKPGNEYSLHVVLPSPISGTASFDASCRLCPVPTIDSVTINFYSDWENEGVWAINLFAQDPLNEENCYLFNWFRNGVPMSDSVHKKVVMDDQMFNGRYMAGMSIFYIDNSHGWETLKPGDTVTLQMSGITRGYMNFISQVQQAGFNLPFFTGPPANVQGNIGNGGSGYFTAYSNSYATTIVK